MSSFARVGSIDALKLFRGALYKFAEEATIALGDAESEMSRVLGWLETEQTTYWQHQIRKRQEELSKAKEALRMKTAFKDASGSKPSAVQEEKAVLQCKRKVEEAEQKLAATRMHARKMVKEIQLYKGAVQRFQTTIASDVPVAAAKLDRMVVKLQAYVALTAPVTSAPVTEGALGGGGGGGGAGGMAQAAGGGGAAAANPWQALRGKTPDAAARAGAGAAEGRLGDAPWAVPPVGERDRQAMAAVPGEREGLDPALRVVLAKGTAGKSRVYLERLAPAFAGDSGWYAGPADDAAAAEYESVRVGDLLQVRPDWAELMTLPAGYLVAIDGGGVVALLDASGQDPRTAAPAEPPPQQKDAAAQPAASEAQQAGVAAAPAQPAGA